ncbi:MAG: rRNA maturation RNase YbeY [Clostridia bacterium]
MPKHNVEIFTELDIEQSVPDLILKCATAVLEYHKIEQDCHIDITITDNEEIHQLNREYREKDYATDVLSFPMVEYHNGEMQDDLDLCIDPDTNELALGDMIISYDKIIEQAREFGHSNEREFAFLTVHSVLHLLGYDHEADDIDADLMRSKEKEILGILGIGR